MSFTNALPPRKYKHAVARDLTVYLDDKELLTPAQNQLRLPTRALADAIAAEWEGQVEKIDPATMPLTQLAMTCIDRIAPQRALVENALLDYMETELICHEGERDDLRAFQQQRWQPVRDWLKQAHGTVLPVTTGLSSVDPDTAWARAALDALDIWEFTAVQMAASICGSLPIALALQAGVLTAETAIDAAEAESDFQVTIWGSDPAAESRRAGLLRELQDVVTFIAKLKE